MGRTRIWGASRQHTNSRHRANGVNKDLEHVGRKSTQLRLLAPLQGLSTNPIMCEERKGTKKQALAVANHLTWEPSWSGSLF